MAELAHVVDAGSNASAFIDWLNWLKTAVGIPETLSAVGVTRGHLPALVDVAMADGCHATNPRPCTRDDFMRFFDEAL
jgi:hypothetical protein